MFDHIANWYASCRGLSATHHISLFAALFLAALAPASAHAQSEAVAASGPPLSLALLVDSDTDRCYDRGMAAAVARLATQQAAKLNARGGVNGRPLDVVVLDSRRDEARTIINVETALGLQQPLAIIGLTSAARGERVFASIGDKIGNSGIPFISHLSVAEIFTRFPNVFSTRPTQEAERVPVMAAYIAEMNFQAVAFLGRSGSAVIDAIGNSLKRSKIANRIVADHRIGRIGQGESATLDPDALQGAIADIKDKQADLVVLSVGTALAESVVDALKAANHTPPIMVIGDLASFAKRKEHKYPSSMFQLVWDSAPEVEQDAVRGVVARGQPQDWLFEGARIPDAPGWSNGRCDSNHRPDPLSSTNLDAIAHGAQFADMVALVAKTAARAGRGASLPDMHRSVLDGLGSTFAAGRGAFKGQFENWSFYPEARVRAHTPYIVILPPGLGRTQLTSVQFVRTRNNGLARVDTVYLDIDMVRIYAINNDQKSFSADFYLAIRASDRIGIDDIGFANAMVNPNTNGPPIAIDSIHSGGPSDAYPESMRIYRVSGQFRFRPDFTDYPFDTQLFSIDIQPKSGEKAFIVQPPPPELRDQALAIDNWQPVSQYVSHAEHILPMVDAFTHEPSFTPVHQARFVWQVKREATDYYLRVVIPLAFILIVAYLSIFIPKDHIEAIITLQVTALQAAVALYLSLPQVDSDTATVSDRIFVLDYMMVSLMILISTLRFNAGVRKWRLVNGALITVHVVMIPLMVLGAAAVIFGLVPMPTLPGW